jgi:uncharacterized protein YndB with AHSA1/START domain
MTKSLPSVTIVRRIKAPPAKVYAALTEPKLMMRWGPDAGPTLSAEADVRPGGRFSVVFRLLNGEEHNPLGFIRKWFLRRSSFSPGNGPECQNESRW